VKAQFQALWQELAQADLFDEGVEAARNACVAGASIASAAITAAAFYDNPLTGLGALRACMQRLESTPPELGALRSALAPSPPQDPSDAPFTPGFGFVSSAQASRLLAAAHRLLGPAAAGSPLGCFLLSVYEQIAPLTGPLNHAGLAALVFLDHRVSPDQAERWYLLARVETAIAEAQKTRRAGLASFPFLSEKYIYEGPRPPVKTFDVDDLRRCVGLD
jgi:hypothetical protein